MAIVHHQIFKLPYRLAAHGMIFRITQDIERHDGVHHGRINGAQSVGTLEALEHPLLRGADGLLANAARAAPLPMLQSSVDAQKHVTRGGFFRIAVERERDTGKEQLFQREPRRYRAARVVRVHDRKRNDDGPGPRGHLVDEVAGQQHQLGWNRRAVLARIKVEEAEIDLDVTVGRL